MTDRRPSSRPDRKTGRRTDKRTDKRTDRRADRRAYGWMDKKSYINSSFITSKRCIFDMI